MARSGRRLSVLLDNGGSTAMNVNGSVSPVTFTLDPGAQVAYRIYALVLTIHSTGMDLGTPADFQNFGAVGAALTNGIRIFTTRGNPAVNVELFPTPVKRLSDFYRYTTWPDSGSQISGQTDGVSAGTDVVRITLSWPVIDPLELRSRSSDKLTVRIADNLTSLALFEAHAIGTQLSVI